jgi:large subunit ribosomal protein L13
MVRIINGEGTILGRLASIVAKELLKGEEINIVNCEKIIITGNRKNIEENFNKKRGRYGSSQKGPIHSRDSEKIVKKTIRGMLPDHRKGRGSEAYKRVKCYIGMPKEFEGKQIEKIEMDKKRKFLEVKEFAK